MSFVGGILHTLPFLIPHYRAALIVAVVTIAFELTALAWICASATTVRPCRPSPRFASVLRVRPVTEMRARAASAAVFAGRSGRKSSRSTRLSSRLDAGAEVGFAAAFAYSS